MQVALDARLPLDGAGLGHAYRRFLSNQLREKFGFEGTPLRILTRRKGEKKKDTRDEK